MSKINRALYMKIGIEDRERCKNPAVRKAEDRRGVDILIPLYLIKLSGTRLLPSINAKLTSYMGGQGPCTELAVIGKRKN